MPRLVIDGKEVEVAPGTTVIRAAQEAGITVPHYCWHPGLSVAGNCRMCLVEVEKMPKLSIACSTQCADGMVVNTANPRVEAARDAIMEFLLINHPLDCPICDQAGECRLQQYSYRYGPGESRFLEEKNHKPKRTDIGPHILLDSERCIVCTRCVRFCQEVTKTDELAVGNRGDHAIIETFPGRSLDNPYSGNTVDICPVGALTLKEFRFRSRVWFLKETATACAGCARGCSITADAKDDTIMRFVPRENPQVNAWWMCDEGRLSWKALAGAPRIAGPTVAGSATRQAWAPALDEAVRRLRGLIERPGTGGAGAAGAAGPVALLASPRATNEDLYAAALFARDGLGGAPVYLAAHERGADDSLLIRSDKSPNARGAREIFVGLAGAGLADAGGAPGSPGAPGTIGTVEDLSAAIASGRVKGLVMMGATMTGFDPESAASLPAIADLAKLEALVIIDSFETPASAAAHVKLPAHVHTEVEGTFTNFLGQVQRVRAAVPPAADAWPAWKIFEELARRLGTPAAQHSGAQAVFASLASHVPAFAGLGYGALGAHGASLPARTKAGA